MERMEVIPRAGLTSQLGSFGSARSGGSARYLNEPEGRLGSARLRARAGSFGSRASHIKT
jgi:hypothetical protein